MKIKSRPAGLYIHVPFCSTRCHYCDFYSSAGIFSGSRETRIYAKSVVAEAKLRLSGENGSDGNPSYFDTIYFGGGTPSLLQPASLAEMMSGFRHYASIPGDAEVTIEANPDDVDSGKARGWLEAGVSRISLGVQSFNDEALGLLGRRHDANCSRKALEVLREEGFEKVAIDLIYGIPGMTMADWELVLREAVSFRPEHISCYMLGIVDSTPMGKAVRGGTIKQKGEEELRELFLHTSRFLTGEGYDHYEVSNYSSGAGNISRHNSKYWDHTPYIGLGPSAHSFDGRRRWWNPSDLPEWREAVESGSDPRESSELLTAAQLAMERLYFGFRTSKGVSLEIIGTFDRGEEVMNRLVSEGYLLIEGENAVPTLEGYLFSDKLPSMFF